MPLDPVLSAEIDVAGNLADVKHAVEAAEREAGRTPGVVSLIAVSKGHETARIRPALEAGHRLFGENRVQEAQAKWRALKDEWPDASVHMIGPLQTNKARDAVALVDAIHSVDREKLAAAIARAADAEGRCPDCFVQVNTGAEPQKAGVLPEEADALVARCRDTLGLPVVGLMCIPPVDEEPSPHFALLEKIAKRNGLASLSMGMSADYAIAIAFGATHVRVGTAIFGARAQSARG